jgi:hypothetical protein
LTTGNETLNRVNHENGNSLASFSTSRNLTEFGPFEASVLKSIKYLVLMAMLKSMHLVPIIYLLDFGHCDAKCSNILLNQIYP